MAWIESHQTLREHPKIYALMDALCVDKAKAIGHLHLLWWWCVDYAPEGIIDKNDQQIARAAEWSGESKIFVDGLISSGFVERCDETLQIHDWLDFCGALVDKRLERMREREISAAKRRTKGAKRQKVLSNRTQPYLTVPNLTKEKGLLTQSPKEKSEQIKKIIEAWNEMARASPPLPTVREPTEDRKRKIFLRLSKKTNGGFLASLPEILRKISASAFCRGSSNTSWVATFDWIIANDKNWVKVLEGNYDTRKELVHAANSRPFDKDRAEALDRITKRIEVKFEPDRASESVEERQPNERVN